MASPIFPDGAPPRPNLPEEIMIHTHARIVFLLLAESLEALAKKSFSVSYVILSAAMASFHIFHTNRDVV